MPPRSSTTVRSRSSLPGNDSRRLSFGSSSLRSSPALGAAGRVADGSPALRATPVRVGHDEVGIVVERLLEADAVVGERRGVEDELVAVDEPGGGQVDERLPVAGDEHRLSGRRGVHDLRRVRHTEQRHLGRVGCVGRGAQLELVDDGEVRRDVRSTRAVVTRLVETPASGSVSCPHSMRGRGVSERSQSRSDRRSTVSLLNRRAIGASESGSNVPSCIRWSSAMARFAAAGEPKYGISSPRPTAGPSAPG